MKKEISLQDFSNSFGCPVDNFSENLIQEIEKINFSYTVPNQTQRDHIILQVLQKLENDKQIIGEPKRKEVWHEGWQENLNDFLAAEGNLETLIPKFIRPDQVIRYDGDYIIPENSSFEYDYMRVFQKWLFRNYFQGCDNIYEFGCGTGMNLHLLSELFPDVHLHGLDFVQSSVDLVNNIGKIHNINLKGYLFDMIQPDMSKKLEQESAVLTFGAIEQLASNFENFLEFLMVNKPKVCIHVEPTVELYEDTKLFDYLAYRFHKQRGYTEGLLPKLKQLDKEKKIDLIKFKRLNFGSLFMEGYTYMIWKPI